MKKERIIDKVKEKLGKEAMAQKGIDALSLQVKKLKMDEAIKLLLGHKTRENLDDSSFSHLLDTLLDRYHILLTRSQEDKKEFKEGLLKYLHGKPL